jgi:hypothetical protein
MESLAMYDYFLTLNMPFRCGRINMWPENKSHIPNFKFRPIDENNGPLLIEKLKSAINKFQGQYQWELWKNPNGSNYIISPTLHLLNFDQNNIPSDVFAKLKNDTLELVQFLKKNVAERS